MSSTRARVQKELPPSSDDPTYHDPWPDDPVTGRLRCKAALVKCTDMEILPCRNWALPGFIVCGVHKRVWDNSKK